MNLSLSEYLTSTYTDQELNRIIYGVLKRLHINFYHPDRADFEQDARIIMAEGMLQFERLVVEPTNGKQQARNVYLYQHLYWRLLDKLKAQQRQQEHIQLSIDQCNGEDDEQKSLEKIFQDLSAEHHFARCETNLFFATLLKRLTPNQRRYLQMIYLGYTGSEIADRLQISRQGVANLRRRVIIAGRQLLKEG